jgi:hypothetical protein
MPKRWSVPSRQSSRVLGLCNKSPVGKGLPGPEEAYVNDTAQKIINVDCGNATQQLTNKKSRRVRFVASFIHAERQFLLPLSATIHKKLYTDIKIRLINPDHQGLG